MPERVWSPLDINGLRLYRVRIQYPGFHQWDKDCIVAAASPTEAAALIEAKQNASNMIVQPVIQGEALNVYQPKEWTE